MDDPTAEALAHAADAFNAGNITLQQWIEFVQHLLHNVEVLCPYCGDWEDVEEVADQLAVGQFWCCSMCAKVPARSPWPSSEVPRIVRSEAAIHARLNECVDRMVELGIDLARFNPRVSDERWRAAARLMGAIQAMKWVLGQADDIEGKWRP